MKKIYLLFIALIFLLTSCSLGGGNMQKTSNQKAENRLEQIINGIQNHDGDALKALFSVNAIKESKDIDECINYMFEYFQGTIQSYSWGDNTIGPISDISVNHGKKKVELKSWFSVITDEEKYMFFTLDYPQDTFDSDNVGLYTLRVVKECDKDTQMTYWQDMKIPGIYIPQ